MNFTASMKPLTGKRGHGESKDEARIGKRQRMENTTGRSSESGKKPDQIGYYTGETRTILELAKAMIRVALTTVDLFPEAKQTKDICIGAFDEASLDVLDCRVKRMYSVALFSSRLIVLVCCLM